MRHVIQQQVQVDFLYPCIFSENVFHVDCPDVWEVLTKGRGAEQRSRVLVVVDQAVAALHTDFEQKLAAYFAHHGDRVVLVAAPVIVPGGEEVKNDPQYVEQVEALVNRYALDRHSYIFAVGGGAVLDMVGYAAAICHRGIRLIRFPTTVLAQNDSGVGVKNGINAFGKKNFLGTFAPPYAVINDFSFLPTLDDRDWRGGISEAIKVALLKDADFFVFLEEHAEHLAARDMDAMKQLIIRCAELHLQHIATSGDPFEAGTSRPLDFGHWAAHKLEQISYFRIRHGEAVALGLALDATYSMLNGMLEEAAWERILRVFVAMGLRVFAPEMLQHHAGQQLVLLQGLEEFREHLGGELTIMLLEDIGRGVETHFMDEALVVQSLEVLQGWAEKRLKS